MKRCTIKTLRLNCGCCDEVIIGCDLEEGHDGMHHMFYNAKNHTYEIVWTDVSGSAPATYNQPVNVSPDFSWGGR